MKQITKSELERILQQHQLWLKTRGNKGARADLQGACLRYEDLRGARLRYANLRGADLQWANLVGAVLLGAALRGVDLREADLRGADLLHANLQGADLREANLRGVDLQCVDLRSVQLDTNIRRCYSFRRAKFTPDALPWLILHPHWSEMQGSVQVEEVAA